MKYNLPAYELIKEVELNDVKGTGFYLRHKKSGARISVVSNDDDNKVFMIGFRTPPTDSTGVAHINEHSVLCGSDKYPIKDPFIELAKGSLNTFLNAMTYPDKTVYPVASCNDKDFANLCDVYMDAVLHPNTYKNEKIFKQEGWHYELDSLDADIKLNGVVYSEMKGVYSDPDQVFERRSIDALFPDTEYGVDSGGDPEVIPSLTYENFLDFHRRYYHPVNSYIYLYGDMDVEERLTWLDREYLSKYDIISLDSSIKVQKPFGGFKDSKMYYSVNEEPADGKGYYYAYSYFAGENGNLIDGIGFEVLDYVLFNAPGAPVHQALVDAGIGDDNFGYYSGDVLQPYSFIGVRNAKPGQKDAFVKTIRTTLEKCVKEGLSEDAIRAAINRQEFRYREADYGSFPKGLLYGLESLSTWLYDDSKPFETFNMNSAYAEIKTKIGTSYFTDLIQKYMLNSQHGVVVECGPKVGLNAEIEKKTEEELKALKASLSTEELQKLIDDTKELKAYQAEPSTPEELATLPLLEIEDIKKEARTFKNEAVFADLGKVIWHDYYTNDITYLKLLFDAKAVAAEEASYVGLLSNMLSIVNTKKHNYKDLNDQMGMYTGGLGVETETFAHKENAFNPYLSLGVKTLTSETEKAVDFLKEIILESDFSDSKRNYEILLQVKSGLESSFNGNGRGMAMRRVLSYATKNGVFDDKCEGYDFYLFVKDLVDNYESKSAEITEKLQKVSEKIFTKDRLTVSITSEKKGLDALKAPLATLMNGLSDKNYASVMDFTPVPKNEGFKTAGQVQFVVYGGDYKKAGVENNGAFQILTSMLSYGYLWNEIRVLGGAYGAHFRAVETEGVVHAGSYRDPNLKRTVEKIKGILPYIENFEADDREMRKAIIGAFGNIDAPLSPRQQGDRAMAMLLTGRTYEDIQKTRDEARNCDVAAIRKTAPLIKAIIDCGYICTVGAAAKIEEDKDLFDNVLNLF